MNKDSKNFCYQLLPNVDEKGEIGPAMLNAPTKALKDIRSDIALLRAIAIISVFAFHFYPKRFPQGFLGVDIFFVISGYLIQRILSTSNSPPFQKISTFYYRRVKRIFPLFYLMLTMTGLAMIFLYTVAWNRRYFPLFASSTYMHLNLKMEDFDMSYFDQKLEGLPFLHTWSLGVEIQFYLLAPLLFYLSTLRINEYRLGWIFMSIIALFSFQYAQENTPKIAFYHPMSRLWQFLVGMISCQFSSESTKVEVKERLLGLINLGSIICFIGVFGVFSFVGKNIYLQISTTIFASLFMLTASYGDVNWSRLRLNYVASLSYALYLIHYPVLEYTKYIAKYERLFLPVNLIGFIVTVVLSVTVHHFFEKPLLKKDKPVVLSVVILFIATCSLLDLSYRFGYIQFKAKNNATLWNLENSQFDFNLTNGEFVKIFDPINGPMGHFQFENGTGEMSVMVIGNSYAPQRATVLEKVFPKNLRSTLDLVAYPGKVIFYQDFLKEDTDYFWELLEKRKPTVVFISMRYIKPYGDYDRYEENGKDHRTRKYLKAIQHLSRFSENIFIETALPFHCEPYVEMENVENIEDFLNDFVDHLEKNATLDGLNLSVDKTFFTDSPVIKRLRFLLKKCPKCHLIQLEEPYYDKEQRIFRTFDPISRKAYIDNKCHFTQAGLDLQEELLRKAVESLIQRYLKREKRKKETL